MKKTSPWTVIQGGTENLILRIAMVIGVQWGDEAKGRFTEFLAEDADIVLRSQGGPNSGHTLKWVDADGVEHTVVLHHIPSGITRVHVINMICQGVVIDPAVLVNKEFRNLAEHGVVITPMHLRISRWCHVIMPWHPQLDALREKMRGEQAIGTTKRGIGPVNVDIANRCGVRMETFIDENALRAHLEARLALVNAELTANGYDGELYTVQTMLDWARPLANKLRPFVTDTIAELHAAVTAGKKILCEMAQSIMLDKQLGDYPYVTSGGCTVGEVCSGAGLDPRRINTVMGVVKPGATRVGGGPFAGEDLGPDGEHIRRRGHEYGSTTGRPRRCGWIDTDQILYAIQSNGLDCLAMAKLDVLSGLKMVKYLAGGKWHEMPGWEDDISDIRHFDELPLNAQEYVRKLQDLLGIPILFISVGAQRDQVIVCEGGIPTTHDVAAK